MGYRGLGSNYLKYQAGLSVLLMTTNTQSSVKLQVYIRSYDDEGILVDPLVPKQFSLNTCSYTTNRYCMQMCCSVQWSDRMVLGLDHRKDKSHIW